MDAIEKIVRRQESEILQLRRMVGCVVRNCQHIDDSEVPGEVGPLTGPAWGKVAYLCGIGSTSALALCREYETDPHFDCSLDPAPTEE
jgi:hypothetical protein